jgi:hypothetical protein
MKLRPFDLAGRDARRGRVLTLGRSRVYRDETRAAVRPFERQVLKLVGADEFLSLTRV